MRFKLFVAVFMSAVLCHSAMAIDYGQLMANKVKEVLGKNATKGYTFSSYPLDNFGLATAYEAKVDVVDQICDTWACLGLDDDTKVNSLSANQRMKLVVGGVQYAAVGTGAPLKLSDDEKSSLGLNALFPKILQILSISFDSSHAKDITTDLTMGEVSVRVLRRQQMLKRVTGANADSAEKMAFQNGTLILVYSDIVVSSVKIEIKINADTNADLQVKMDGALKGQAGKIIGQGSSLGFKVDKADKGDYTFEINRPLILAVYTKKQQRPNQLGGGNGWKDWADFDLGAKNKVLSEKVDLVNLNQ